MNIPRFLQSEIIQNMTPGKVVVLYGPRQAGKTTLLMEILKEIKEDYLLLSGEDRNARAWLASESIETLRQNIGNKRLLAIDEAQKIENIGLNLKLIVDHLEGMRVIVTGSSSFDLANRVGEPLVGRKWQYTLFPIAQMELAPRETLQETKARLPLRLVFGSYPEVITHEDPHERMQILNAIVDNHLYRDLLNFEEIRKSRKIMDILKLLAFQIGKEVSLHEIGQSLGLHAQTVEKYLDLLEKVFVIMRVSGFSRNLRKEITKTSRFYFYDNGVRNALINNFNALDSRDDVGMLWENYLFMERIKKQRYQKIYANNYFWRTYDQKEIDLVEEREGKLFGYEFKWGVKKKKPPKLWLSTYKNAEYQIIGQENYLEFIA
jgi:hypothetical protein